MARIFLSHSSRDNAQAVAIRDWLATEGWDDIFLDLDPSRGIAAGERWERRLHEAANRCEAILFLVSRAWLDSEWCLREFRLAQKLNKRSFGVLIEPIPLRDLPAELTANWQFVDLAQGTDHRIFRAVLPNGSESHVTLSTAGLKRLKTGLTRAGLDARYFEWPPNHDPDRPPYRGMRPLEADDAGIFFGREAPTIEALDRLRGLSEAAPPRFMVILGASGAGKSSFLRAGLLPRLARDDRNFLPLHIVRPERAALTGETGLIRSLEIALAAANLQRTRAELKAAIESGALAVAALLATLAEKVRAPAGTNESRPHPPRIVLAIDQAEELFLAEGAGEAEAFLRLVRDLSVEPASNLIVVATIRSDAYERLQTAPALEDLRQETFSLPPLPRGAYQTVIEGPAARLAETSRPLKVEPALTAALLRDVEEGGAKDALPLLAFSLERLYLEHGGDGDLRLSEYRQVGGIKGSIDAAVEGALRAADADPAVPRDRAAREALLRRALIPWLAGIDPETGAPRRRVARLSEIPEEARPLVSHLIAARLLATDRNPDTGETTVEPAHEALLRQWGLLQGWLEEDFAALSSLEAVKRAARDWEANARAGDWLAHGAGRLDDAEALLARDDFAASLDPSDRAYLAGARAADTARRNRELEEARKLATAEKEAADRQRQVSRRTRIGLIAASVLALLAVGAAIYGFAQARKAEEQADLAASTLAESRETTSQFLADMARQKIDEGSIDDAIAIARRAVPVEVADWPRVRTAVNALRRAIHTYQTVLVRPIAGMVGHSGTVRGGQFSPDGKLITWSYDGTARLWDVESGDELKQFSHGGGVRGATLSADGSRLLTWAFDGVVRVWPTVGTGPPVSCPHTDVVVGAVWSTDETRTLSWSYDGTALICDAATGARLAELKHEGVVRNARFFAGDSKILTFSADGTVRTWDAENGAPVVTLRHEDEVRGATLFDEEERLLTWSYDKTARIWMTSTGKESVSIASDAPVGGVVLDADQRMVLSWANKTLTAWNIDTGAEIARIPHDHGAVRGAALSPDGKQIITWASDNNVRLWKLDGTLVSSLGHSDLIVGAVFSPSGKEVLSWSRDATAIIWSEPASERPARRVLRHGGVVRGAAFSEDGVWVTTRSDDGAIRLWLAASGSLNTKLPHEGEVFVPSSRASDGRRFRPTARQGSGHRQARPVNSSR